MLGHGMVKDVILLGLLMDGPRHGYHILRLVRDVMADVVRMSPGSVYYTLDKLERGGLVTHREARVARRPDRKVFSITEKGRGAFADLVVRNLVEAERPYWDMLGSVLFLREVAPEESRAALEQRRTHTEEALARVRRLQRFLAEHGYPKLPQHVVEHAIKHLQVDREMLGRFAASIESGEDEGNTKTVHDFYEDPGRIEELS